MKVASGVSAAHVVEIWCSQSQMATLVEYSKSSTALCRNPQCGHPSRNILKGTIRFKVPDLGFTHLECLPSGFYISAQNLDGLAKLKREDRHAVEAQLKAQTSYRSPGNVRIEQKPFLTLLQNVLDTVTKATNVVSTQGDQVACAVLLQDLQSICQAQHASLPFGSPIAQVSLDGSTPHTVSTLSSRNTAPHSVQSEQTTQSAHSVHSTVSTHSMSTPAQVASFSAALLGAESADRSDRTQPPRDSTSPQIHGLPKGIPQVPLLYHPSIASVSAEMHTLETIPEKPALSVPDPVPPPSPRPPVPGAAGTAEDEDAAVSHLPTLSPNRHAAPVTRATPRAVSVATEAPHQDQHQHQKLSSHSAQKKHARVIEAATAPHPTHRNKHSKGYAALQAHLKTHVQAQKYSQALALQETAAEFPPTGRNSSSSSSGSSSVANNGVLARLAPQTGSTSSNRFNSGMKMVTAAGAMGLGSPTPTRKVQLLTELSQQYQTAIASGGAGSSRASPYNTSQYSTISTSTSSSTSAVPGSHSALRLLLRAEQEQRRKTLPQTVPRFRSATSAYLAQAEQHAEQPALQQRNRQGDGGERQGRNGRGMKENV